MRKPPVWLLAAGLSVTLLSLPEHAGASRGSQILSFASRWLGTHYLWGGTTRAGVDCSGYLRQMYRDLFRIELPRTTRGQIKLGRNISLNPKRLAEGLEPGDLLFYVDGTGTPNHVVIYAGGGKVTHSVSGRGVVVDPIRKVYGRRLVARRLLIPSSRNRQQSAPMLASGPIEVQLVPCPAEFKASPRELRRLQKRRIQPQELTAFSDRAICELLALSDALLSRKSPTAQQNGKTLKAHAEWMDSVEALRGGLEPTTEETDW